MSEIKEISPEELEIPYEDLIKNKNDLENRWKEIERDGTKYSVVTNKRDDKLIVVDGEQRLKLFSEEKDTIPVKIVDVSKAREVALALKYKNNFNTLRLTKGSMALKEMKKLSYDERKEICSEELAEQIEDMVEPDRKDDGSKGFNDILEEAEQDDGDSESGEDSDLEHKQFNLSYSKDTGQTVKEVFDELDSLTQDEAALKYILAGYRVLSDSPKSEIVEKLEDGLNQEQKQKLENTSIEEIENDGEKVPRSERLPIIRRFMEEQAWELYHGENITGKLADKFNVSERQIQLDKEHIHKTQKAAWKAIEDNSPEIEA